MIKPPVVVAIIRDSEGRLLFEKRAEGRLFPNQWAFVSGNGASKKGWPPAHAVIGEVMYDLGTRFHGREFFRYTIDANYASEVIVFIGSIEPTAIALNPKAASAYDWVALDDVEKLGLLAFQDDMIIDRYRQWIKERE